MLEYATRKEKDHCKKSEEKENDQHKEQDEGKPLGVGRRQDTTPPEVPAQERHVHLGETETHEMVDWEHIFHKHLEETREMEKARMEQIEKAEKKEQSWQLLRECRNYLRENENHWQFLNNEKPKMKKKQEEKNRRLELSRIQKKETLKKIKQKKIEECWNMLPEHKKRKIIEVEEREKRLDLK